MSELASTEEQVDHGSLFSQSIKKSICYDSNSYHHTEKNKNQNSNSTNSCKVITNPLLLEDLRFHIFTFVHLNCLLNSIRYVCKPWAETIGSSRFAEACQRRAHYKFGLYVENCTTLGNSYFLEFKDYVSGQFERTNLETPQKMRYIIGTCDGMLLLKNSSSKDIFLVNPLLKCWLRLPCYDITLQKRTKFRYQGAITRVPRTGKFKLFFADCIEVLGVFWYVLYVLRIGKDNSWKEIFRKESPLQRHFKCQILYSGGDDLYWITKKVVFLLDVDKELIVRECQLSYAPNGPDQRYLLMGDRLSCIESNDFGNTFQIYVLNFDSGKLSLYHEMGPFDFVAICGHEVYIASAIFRWWINNQIIFQVYVQPNEMISSSYKRIPFGYNVKTRQLTKIGDIDIGNFEVWLHTNNLISLPNTS